MIERLPGFFILQWGWKRALSAFCAGLISALAMPPVDLFWILFVTFPVLVWLIDGTAADPGSGAIARLKPAFVTGWWFGFGYFLAGLWWVGTALLVDAATFGWMIPFVVTGFPALLALFWAVAVAIARMFWSDDWRRIVILSASLGMAEYLRGTLLTGFPWNTLGYAAMTSPQMMQTASLIGLYGVTPLAIMVFSTLAIIAPGSGRKPRRMRALLIVSLLLTTGHLGFGYWRLHKNPPDFVVGVKLRIVQPAIDQEDKWRPENEADIFNSYLALSKSSNAQITHYIWPESAFPFILTERRDALAAIAELLPEDAHLITGAMRIEAGVEDTSEPRVFNSVYVINHEGEITGASDKNHLVPFGEYMPFQQVAEMIGLQQLTMIEGGFTQSTTRQILATKFAGPFLPLICFEIVFPGQIRPVGEAGTTTNPSWIVNLTNDAWFGRTSGPYQHHRQSIIRGVEEGLPVIRAANNGISSVSDPYGRIHGLLALNKRGVVDANLPTPAPATFYYQTQHSSSYRDLSFFVICACLLLVSVRIRRLE